VAYQRDNSAAVVVGEISWCPSSAKRVDESPELGGLQRAVASCVKADMRGARFVQQPIVVSQHK
jgi:hypothetical protein